MSNPHEKRKRGRPAKPLPEPIDAPAEEVAEVVMGIPNKTEWRYLKKHGGRDASRKEPPHE